MSRSVLVQRITLADDRHSDGCQVCDRVLGVGFPSLKESVMADAALNTSETPRVTKSPCALIELESVGDVADLTRIWILIGFSRPSDSSQVSPMSSLSRSSWPGFALVGQLSAPSHTVSESVSGPAEMQAPPWQVSATLQRSPLSQIVPFGSNTSAGQLSPAPSQKSATSHWPASGRQSAVLLASVGQALLMPSQLSAMSQTPAEARHSMVVLPSAGQSTPTPSQFSVTSQKP